MLHAALAVDRDALASGAYSALVASLDAGDLPAEHAEVFRAAADARLFGEPDLDQRMQAAYASLIRLADPGAGVDRVTLRRIRNQLFSIPLPGRSARGSSGPGGARRTRRTT